MGCSAGAKTITNKKIIKTLIKTALIVPNSFKALKKPINLLPPKS